MEQSECIVIRCPRGIAGGWIGTVADAVADALIRLPLVCISSASSSVVAQSIDAFIEPLMKSLISVPL